MKFVEYRLKPETMEMCKRNKEARKKQIFNHTCSAMTFARKRHILILEAGKPVGRGPMWDMTHKRADGKYVNEEAQKIGVN
ncbi:putative transposase, Ptta/En/Spm, plant [Medicago truncatula]|uniref:Putative transposase, Ptta/En/Spm, plant n=1 Tax=Medicago truncatula TaxID=3880 RepID=A0A396JTY3_MEDTR|nr:putative transposase, Ptta/En/Spm, plant [Medicago truncatula]